MSTWRSGRHAALRSLAQRALERQGHTVLTAPNGAAALALAKSHHGPIELVISGVVMPGMGGRPLVEELQRDHRRAGSSMPFFRWPRRYRRSRFRP